MWAFIEYLCIPDCSIEPGVLLWPFIAYLCIPDCSFEPGVLLWPFIDYWCFSYCSFEPGVLLWPFITYLCMPCCSLEPGVLLWPFIECVYIPDCSFELSVLLWHISVFHIARLSQAFSCGHLLIISVFHIPHFCNPYCSFEPGAPLWPFIDYFSIPYTIFLFSILLV